MGSSLGGYLAALYAARHPEISRAILLAPAFGLYDLWVASMGPQRLEEWRRNGSIPAYHYAAGRELPLAYHFLEDAGEFEPFPDLRQPVLIFHGLEDAVVPVQQSLRFVQNHPAARLVQLSSGHELTDVLDSIWQQAKPFLLAGDET